VDFKGNLLPGDVKVVYPENSVKISVELKGWGKGMAHGIGTP